MGSLSAYKKLVCMKCFWAWIGTGLLIGAFAWITMYSGVFDKQKPDPILVNLFAGMLLVIMLAHLTAAIWVNYYMYKDLFLEIRSTYRMIRYGEEETENEETEEGRLSS